MPRRGASRPRMGSADCRIGFALGKKVLNVSVGEAASALDGPARTARATTGRMSLRMLIRDERRPLRAFGCHLFFSGARRAGPPIADKDGRPAPGRGTGRIIGMMEPVRPSRPATTENGRTG